jgi:hypothetical protein
MPKTRNVSAIKNPNRCGATAPVSVAGGNCVPRRRTRIDVPQAHWPPLWYYGAQCMD